MSERVGYAVGTRPIDVFPAEIRTGAPTGDEVYSYPYGFTRDQAIIILSRVRKWHITGSISCVNGSNPAIYGDFTADALASFLELDGITPAIDERATVNAAYPSYLTGSDDALFVSEYGNSTYQNDSIASGTAEPDAPITHCGWGPNRSKVIFYDSGAELFYPNFEGDFGVNSNNPGGFHYRFSNVKLPFMAGPFSIAVKLDAKLFSIVTLWSGLYSDDNWFDFDFNGGSCTGEIVIEATDFFAYKNSAGLPIYDTASGAQLRSPFS